MTQEQHEARRGARTRLAAVTGTAVLAVALAVVAAACTRDAATNRAAVAAATLRTRTVGAVDVIAHNLPTTTTTTRPAVSPEFGPPPTNTGAGRRIVYCNSCQLVWLVDEADYVVARFPVSGRRATPAPGVYHVFRKLAMGRSKAHPDLRLPNFVGFAWGTTTDIGFHGIPLRGDGSPIQSDAQLGTPLSSGCVREHQWDAKYLYDWTPEGTTVVVTA